MSTTVLAETRVPDALGRYYDPTTAQFLTPDPLFAFTGERYGYAGNDPINGSDPTGMFGWSSITHAAHDVVAAPGQVAHTVNNDIVHPVAHATAAAGEWTWNNRGTIMTGVAIGTCVLQPEFCAVAAVTAYGVRAEQRVQDNGWSGSWRTNLVDLAVTGATLGVGSYLEGLEGFPEVGTLARRLYDGMYAFPDIASFLEGRLTGEDTVEALTGYGEEADGCQ